jgi:DNA ligase 1
MKIIVAFTSRLWCNGDMNDRDMQHGVAWGGQDMTGCVVTEKLDGARAYWDGRVLWTRGGIRVSVPPAWKIPGIALDCELYAGPGQRGRCAVALVHSRIASDMVLYVFDAPDAAGDYEDRMRVADAAVVDAAGVRTIPRAVARDTEHALEMMIEVVTRGGEGVMVRQPSLAYKPGRTRDMYKVKLNE